MKGLLKLFAVLGLVLVLLAGAAGSALAGGRKFFRDEDQAPWAKAYLAAASLKGLLKGDPDGRFRPNDPLRREELVTALVRFAGLEEVAGSMAQAALPFRDSAEVLRKAAWARGYLAAARDAGILPQEEDRFGPGEAADRLWAAELLVRALGLQGEAELRAGEGVPFRDVGDVPPEKLGYLAVAVERGLLQGFPDGTFRPKEKLTRAQLAALLERAALYRKQLGKYEVRGTVAEVVYGEKQEIALYLDGSQKDLRRYPVSPDALVLVDAREAALVDVKSGFRACLVLNAEETAVVVSARSAEPEKRSAPLFGWLVDLPDLEGASFYGLVPGVRWGQVKDLLDEKYRLRVERGPGEGLEWREEGKFPALRSVVALVPADDGVAKQMESLLGKFVEVRVERVAEPNIYMRPVFRVLEVRGAEPPGWLSGEAARPLRVVVARLVGGACVAGDVLGPGEGFCLLVDSGPAAGKEFWFEVLGADGTPVVSPYWGREQAFPLAEGLNQIPVEEKLAPGSYRLVCSVGDTRVADLPFRVSSAPVPLVEIQGNAGLRARLFKSLVFGRLPAGSWEDGPGLPETVFVAGDSVLVEFELVAPVRLGWEFRRTDGGPCVLPGSPEAEHPAGVHRVVVEVAPDVAAGRYEFRLLAGGEPVAVVPFEVK